MNAKSLENVEKWKNQLNENVKLPNEKPLPVILLVNKSDLTENGLSDGQIKDVCEKCGITQWIRVWLGCGLDFQVSAKTAMNISDSVDKLLDSIVIYDDIWGKEENGSQLLKSLKFRRRRTARYRKII